MQKPQLVPRFYFAGREGFEPSQVLSRSFWEFQNHRLSFIPHPETRRHGYWFHHLTILCVAFKHNSKIITLISRF